MKRAPFDTHRVKTAITAARQLLRAAGEHGQQDLTRALLLQGILSGDTVAAAIAERQRLQKENLRLRQRLTFARLRTERAKASLLERAATRPTPLQGIELINQLRAIYSLAPLPLLPAPEVNRELEVNAEIVPPVSLETGSDPPVRGPKEIQKDPEIPPAPK
jgi:hypothetical protein